MWGRVFSVVVSTCLLGLVSGQGYGAINDDSESFGGNNQFNNQQANSLPQYENAGGNQAQGGGGGGQGNGQNLWWQGQNAFQQPPGHPGVQPLGQQNNQQRPNQQQPQQQQPQNNYNQPASYSPPPQNFNPQGNGQQPQQAPPQYNNPPPIPQEPSPQQFNPYGGGQQQQQPQYNAPAQQQQPHNAPQNGWNAPAPQQQYQPQGQGFNQPDEAPGCDLVNKADCHKRQNYQPPPQNYQPPPLNPQPYPEQEYSPAPQQQVPQPNLGYRPPPPQQEPNNYLPNPSYNPPPASPPQPYPQQPPPQPDPQPYQPPVDNPPQPQQPPTQPEPRPKPYQPPQQPRPRPAPQQAPAQPEEEPAPYPGCPAAMICVQDEYCNMLGVAEENPVQLSAAQKLHRVALMQCSEPMTGIVGYCCRDPNYTDPWPDMNGMMPKKDMHHPKPQGQKLQNFQPQQPPISNHLANGGGNPYSGQEPSGRRSMGWGRNVQCNDNGQGSPAGYIR